MLNYCYSYTSGTVYLVHFHFHLQHTFYGIHFFLIFFCRMICSSICNPFMEYRDVLNTSKYSIYHLTWDFQLGLWLWLLPYMNIYHVGLLNWRVVSFNGWLILSLNCLCLLVCLMPTNVMTYFPFIFPIFDRTSTSSIRNYFVTYCHMLILSYCDILVIGHKCSRKIMNTMTLIGYLPA